MPAFPDAQASPDGRPAGTHFFKKEAIMAKSDKQFEAEMDFQSLAHAEEIKSSAPRFKAAKTAGKRVVAQEKKALAVKQRVAKPAPRRER